MKIYTLDTINSEIRFSVGYLKTATVEGHFTSFSGELKADSAKQLLDIEIEFEIYVASINTHEPIRNQHLISADFFHTDLYPKIHFKKTSIQQINANEFNLYGDLTIKNVTKNVMFHVELCPTDLPVDDFYAAPFHCKTSVARIDFGLVYGSLLESSPIFISKEVDIDVFVKFQNS